MGAILRPALPLAHARDARLGRRALLPAEFLEVIDAFGLAFPISKA